MSKKALLIPVILIVLALAVVATVLVLSLGGNGNTDVEEPPVQTEALPIRFAKAVLTCDEAEIRACVPEQLKDDFAARYGANDVQFSNCQVAIAGESALLRDGLEYYSSMLNRDYGIQATLESGCFYTLDFTGEFRHNTYSGTMTVMTAAFDGVEYVVSVKLDRIDDTFYEDNFPAGDYYFDMHGEE